MWWQIVVLSSLGCHYTCQPEVEEVLLVRYPTCVFFDSLNLAKGIAPGNRSLPVLNGDSQTDQGYLQKIFP